MANKSSAAAPGPTTRRQRGAASRSIRPGDKPSRIADSASSGPLRKLLAAGSAARKNAVDDEDRRGALNDLRTAGSRAPVELVQRLVDTGLRLFALRDSDALCASVIEAAAQFIGAQRVLLVLSDADGLCVVGSLVPKGEDARTLLHAVTPWFSRAQRTRAASLRHGPEGADPVDQRSCLIAPLIAQHELLGYLYADVEGVVGRFREADRDLLVMVASQAAAALANIRFGEGLQRNAAERTAELTEALEYQTAIGQVLHVIGESATDVAPVLEVILDCATRLFQPQTAAIYRYDGRLIHVGANRNWTPEATEKARIL